MPPEQAAGAVQQVDERSDVFGLGAILCQVLTGQPPFTGEDGESVRLKAVQGRVAEAFARLDGSGAEPELIELAKRCLTPDRDARPRNASEVASAVAGLRAAANERARQAEVEHAAAMARAAELRKRRKVQAALALAFVALVAVAGAAFWWQDRERAAVESERAARRAGTEASVTAAIREARERIAETWGLTNDTPRMQSSAEFAMAALQRADGFVAAGDADEATRGDLAAAHAELDELRRHVRLLTDIDDYQLRYTTDLSIGNSQQARGELIGRCAAALRRFGVDPLSVPPAETARRVAASRFRDILLAMITEWQCHAPFADRPSFPKLNAVIREIRRACGGPYTRWQEILDREDVPALVRFAVSTEPEAFQWQLLCTLARDLLDRGEFVAMQQMLRAAIERYPHALWLHMHLAEACRLASPPSMPEAIRHMTAATVLRPKSAFLHVDLAFALREVGDLHGAVATFRKVTRLAPDNPLGHAHLSSALGRLGDREGAVAAAREAFRLAGSDPSKMNWVAVVIAESGQSAEAMRGVRAALAANPTWVNDSRNYLRYNSACFAVRCATGVGVDAPPPAERPEYRRQALELLTADLAESRKLAAREPVFVHDRMQHWLADQDLAPVRSQTEVEKLPIDERAGWVKLWTAVRELRDATAPPEQAPLPRPK